METNLSDSDSMERILMQIGYHPVFRYEKFRTEYSSGSVNGKALLDETPIGNFLELEGGPQWIERTAKLLGFSRKDYINRSYGYLYLAYCRERRIRPKDMIFKNAGQN
jgi:adenylate cyclase class 2